MDDALDKSSYDEFVHDPINPQSIFRGQSFSFKASFILLIGVAISGEKGPFIWGSSSDKFISIT
jgi:hypothetical protein